MNKQNKTHRYREQIDGHQRGRGRAVVEMDEGDQLYGDRW